jgi:excisionase family DNA binding protein
MAKLEQRRTYKIEEAGRLLGIGRNCAYDAAKSGQLPVIKIGRRLLVSKAALDRMLDGEVGIYAGNAGGARSGS